MRAASTLDIPARPAREKVRAAEKPKPLQSPATGFAGAFAMLAMYIAYTQFQARVPSGGPNWSSLWGFQGIARDYVDIFLCLATAFLVMVTFEKALQLTRGLALAVVAVAATVVGDAGQGVVPFGGEVLTHAELGLFGGLAGLLSLLVLDLGVRVRSGAIARRKVVPWARALRSGFFRWLALWSVISLAVVVYQGSKLYSGLPLNSNGYYLNWRVTSGFIWWVFTTVGLAYCVLTVRYHHKLGSDRTDSAVGVLLLVRRAWRRGPRAALRSLEVRRVRVALGDVAVKFFWAPLMVTFMFNECGNLRSNLAGAQQVFARFGILGGVGHLVSAFFQGGLDEAFVDHSYHALYHGLFVVDVSVGLLGYLSASRWLGNKSKSVETSGFGWMVALACYPPFNDVTGQIVPYDASHGPAYALFNLLFLQRLMMVLTLALFTIYVWGTVVFGLRFSNLTHRGLIESGPYKWIRHPAYATKNIAWWTESVLRFGSPWQFVYILGCNLLYALRAYTEEQHLLQFEDYRAYCKKVKWRFLPGVF